MKYFILAGEASGDLHGANLIRALKAKDPEAEFLGFGGDRMEGEGCTLLRHVRDISFMGFVEVAANLPAILKNFKVAKEGLKTFNPDRVVLVDYPGFNLRMAKFAKEEGYHVSYYIAPQVWAWKAKRTEQLKAFCDQVLVILPFEESFLKKAGVNASFVGHPLIDAFELDFAEVKASSETNDLALLPGSRAQEIKRILPTMISAIEQSGVEAKIAKAPSLASTSYPNISESLLFEKGTYALLGQSRRALVTSGTATLETALMGIPQAVCYKTSPLSYAIGKRLIKVKYISLVNLIFDAEVVPEYIQADCNPKTLKAAIERMNQEDYREEMKTKYAQLQTKLGGGGASARAAENIMNP